MPAKKSLGQHFLKSKRVAAYIAEAAQIGLNDSVLEIGPGKGILTEALLARAGHIVAVEKDPELVAYLKRRFPDEIKKQKLVLVQGDALRFDPARYAPHDARYKVVANIPYYITGALLKHVLTLERQPASMTLVVQKEVAERIVARNGKESILSLSVKAYGMPRYVKTVRAGVFTPKPKVDSAILTIENISRVFFTENDIDESAFFALVKKGFAHKRKKLASNLEIPSGVFESCGITLDIRAEDLSLGGWRCLTRQCSHSRVSTKRLRSE
jgi:16S rRNA (adenine1518-N6/adenine1519-N6)-dimethyltransferase